MCGPKKKEKKGKIKKIKESNFLFVGMSFMFTLLKEQHLVFKIFWGEFNTFILSYKNRISYNF